MDRSSTPEASSQVQQQQTRRQNNRSRSGSAELPQIIEQGAKYKYGILSPSMSTTSSSSSDGISSPATPVLERGNSPGVLSWVRNALLLASFNGRNTPPVAITSQPAMIATAKNPTADASLNSIDTPLMPGTVRSFHTRAADWKEEEEDKARQQKKMIDSVRSSFTLEAPFSWNPFDQYQRRGSSVSNATTAEYDGSSTSSDEYIYAAFSCPNEQDFAAKKVDRIEGGKDKESRTELDASLGLSSDAAMSKFGLDHGQESEQLIQDTTTSAQPMPNLVLTPPDSSPRPVGSPIASIASWTDSRQDTDSFQRPLLERRQSDNKTPVPRDNRSISVMTLTDSGSNLQPSSESEVEKSLEGDGEDLEDLLGRPRSPQELTKHRPSKESVVLGSREARHRADAAGRKVKLSTGLAEGADSTTNQATTPLPATPIKEATTSPQIEQINKVNGAPLTTAPQPRRAMNFFTRRRESSLNGKPEVETREVNKKEASNSNQATFWKLGKKQNNPSTLDVMDGDSKRNKKQTGELENLKGRASMDSKYFPRVNTNDSTNSSVGKEGKDSKIKKKEGLGLGLLGSSMQPRAVRVRRIKKTQKDRDFARVYLAQELFLGSSSSAFTSEDANVSKAASTSPFKPDLPHLDSNTSVASSLASSNATFASSMIHPKKKATWAMKFSLDGKHLAVAGQDAVIRVYAVLDTENARKKVESEAASATETLLDTLTYNRSATNSVTSLGKCSTNRKLIPGKPDSILPNLAVFNPTPIREFKGHTCDILDLNWSKGGFLLSASMDKTARVWHLSWPNSLVSFAHGDFVTSAVFHPRDDRFFLSGSLDGKLRLWNISAKKVQSSQEVPGLITACAFTESGNTACVGTFAGHALFYHTEGLIYSSSIAVRSPSGKHAKGGRKITSIDPLLSNNEGANSTGTKTVERILITSNDSRIRAYDLKHKSMIARFKAKTYTNRTSQIKANVSDDNIFIVAGSEATCGDGGQVYIWNSAAHLFDTNKKLLSKFKLTGNGSSKALPSSLSTDFNVEYFSAHSSTVTCAIIAPLATNTLLKASQDYILQKSERKLSDNNGEGSTQRHNRIIVSVDETAVVRVWRSDSFATVG